MVNPLDVQVAGGHYKDLKIQPVEYIHANNIPFIEGCIIKYATRWRSKNGIEDLKKIIHFTELLIELETKNEREEASKSISRLLFDRVVARWRKRRSNRSRGTHSA